MQTQCSNAYLAARVTTSNGMDLVIALYEAALASLARAIEAIEKGDDSTRSECISHVAQVIMALSEAIDFTQPGPLAGDLSSLYNYQLRQLLEANRTKDIEPLQVVKGTLTSLLEAWRQVAVPTSSPSASPGNRGGAGAVRDGESVSRRVDGFNMRRPSLRMTA